MSDALGKVLAEEVIRRQPSQTRGGVRLRVLVVDDNDYDADLVSEYLMGVSSMEFEIQRAKRLEHAINLIALAPPDIILLDLGLPDSHGTETFARLRTSASSIPLVVFTGHDDVDIATTLIKAGAQDFLVKGLFDDDALVRTLSATRSSVTTLNSSSSSSSVGSRPRTSSSRSWPTPTR